MNRSAGVGGSGETRNLLVAWTLPRGGVGVRTMQVVCERQWTLCAESDPTSIAVAPAAMATPEPWIVISVPQPVAPRTGVSAVRVGDLPTTSASVRRAWDALRGRADAAAGSPARPIGGPRSGVRACVDTHAWRLAADNVV